MHVLGLPPAFVLSQDQTLKLKSWILDGLEGISPRIHCVTGTFTLTRLARVSPRGHAMVMAETQLSPESRMGRPLSSRKDAKPRKDSAACVSLSSYQLVKELP